MAPLFKKAAKGIADIESGKIKKYTKKIDTTKTIITTGNIVSVALISFSLNAFIMFHILYTYKYIKKNKTYKWIIYFFYK